MSVNENRQSEHEEECINIIKSEFSWKNCFGLTTEDYSIMEKCLEEIVPNEKNNEFPDFVLPNGFVEHFMITSSKLDRKGAAHKIAMSKFEKKMKNWLKNCQIKNQLIKIILSIMVIPILT